MLPSCLGHTRRLGTKAANAPLATPLYLPPPASTRDGAALARDAVLGVHAPAHATKEEKREKGPRVPGEMEKTKTRWKGSASNEGGFEVGALRVQGCTNRARSDIEIYLSGSI